LLILMRAVASFMLFRAPNTSGAWPSEALALVEHSAFQFRVLCT
jgi:hypothetical protein